MLKDIKKNKRVLQDRLETSKEITEQAEELFKTYKKIDLLSGTFDMFGNTVKDIPIIRDIFREFTEASKQAVSTFKKTDSLVKGFESGFKEVGIGLSKAGLAGALTLIGQGMISGRDAAEQFALQLNRSDTISKALAARLTGLSKEGDYFNIRDLTEIVGRLADVLGTGSILDRDTLRDIAILQLRLGLSSEAAGNLVKFSSSTGEEISSIVDNTIRLTEEGKDLNKVNIRYKDIFDDIGKASQAVLLTNQKFPGGFIQAAYQARRFGLSLEQLERTSESLLNFQSSIEAELEAELLTGRRLNLEQARMAALMGNQGKLAEEIAKNVGSIEEFSSMYAIEQEALAKAFGMSRKELADTLTQRKTLLDLAEKEKLTLRDTVSQQNVLGELTKKYEREGLSAADARLKALEKVGDIETARLEKTQLTQERIATQLENLGQQLAKIFGVNEGNFIDKLADNIQSFTQTITDLSKVVSKFLPKTVDFSDTESELRKKIAEKGKEGLTPIERKTAEAIDKLRRNRTEDPIGKLLNQQLSPFERFQLEEDIRQYQGGSTLKLDDFTIRANPKDTLVMAGGTRFGEETNKLLEKLIDAVKENKGVYLDGRAVGEALATNYTAFG